MNDLNSFLPPIEIEPERLMRIEQLQLDDFPTRMCETRIKWVDINSNAAQPLTLKVRRIDRPSVLGYIPTKCFHDGLRIRFLYYISKALPSAARPFGNSPCYVFVVTPPLHHAIEYNSEMRIFIDQIQTPDGMSYVFIFGEDEMQKVLAHHWDGRTWEEANPVLEDWNRLEGESAGEDVGPPNGRYGWEWDDPDGGK